MGVLLRTGEAPVGLIHYRRSDLSHVLCANRQYKFFSNINTREGLDYENPVSYPQKLGKWWGGRILQPKPMMYIK